jgi:hypothetical protein
MNALSTSSTTAKIVLNRKQANVETLVTTYDAGRDTNVPIACTVGQPAPTACTAIEPSATCSTTGANAGKCVTTGTATSILYNTNVTPQNNSVTINVPCDAATYIAEVYGAGAAGVNGTIVEGHKSAEFTMVPKTPPATGCDAPAAGVAWSDVVFPSLSVTPGAITAGMPDPYGDYTVDVQNLQLPWSTTDWSMKQGTSSPVSFSGSTATFHAPAAGTATVDFTGTFHLDASLLLPAESDTAWTRVVSLTGVSVSQTGGVTGP